MTQATEVFGNEAKTILWLKFPMPPFDARNPLACGETVIGLREVEYVLTRIVDVVYE